MVPVDYLVAMKLAAARRKDDEDVEEIVASMSRAEYSELREAVLDHLGYGMANRLDRITREIGHPGPGPEKGC